MEASRRYAVSSQPSKSVVEAGVFIALNLFPRPKLFTGLGVSCRGVNRRNVMPGRHDELSRR